MKLMLIFLIIFISCTSRTPLIEGNLPDCCKVYLECMYFMKNESKAACAALQDCCKKNLNYDKCKKEENFQSCLDKLN